MEYYQITDLEQLTGIKAHTIRIWEKRYGLITPKRTSTNIRFYDNDEARRLLNITTLVKHGYKISKLATLSESEIAELLRYTMAGLPNDAICETFINNLIAAMLKMDEVAFEKTFASLLVRFGLYKGMLDVIYPFLMRLGILWQTNDVAPIQEHFASGIIRRKLMSAIDGLPQTTKKHKRFILFLPPEEWHEIGLLFSEYLIRKEGIQVINLGQNVPYQNVIHISRELHPTHILTFFVARKEPAEMNGFLKTLLKDNPEARVLISGSSFNMDEIVSHKNLIRLQSPQQLVEML
ncbi:MAG: MerR family transcriptional regulator [Bacteroidetes bacterium]|nr:MerR family transcriptional regulator [Bacteroidota bacterium]